MAQRITILVLLMLFYQCNGHLGRLHDAVAGAHKHVHDTVHDVASSVVGGLTGGFSFNFGGNVQSRPSTGLFGALNPFRRPTNEQPHEQFIPERPIPEERPPQGNYYPQQGNRDEHYNQQGQTENHQYVQPTPPGRPSSENKPVHQYDANDQFHRPEQQGDSHQQQDRDVKEPTESPIDSKKPASFGTTAHTDGPAATNKPQTTAPNDDAPLFVPLTPDQYKYEGEKIEVNAPKRETDKAQEEYDIDIRFRDQ